MLSIEWVDSQFIAIRSLMSFALTAFARVLYSTLLIHRKPATVAAVHTAPQAASTEADALSTNDQPEPDTLRVGSYTIGQGDCAELYGHPDIRY